MRKDNKEIYAIGSMDYIIVFCVLLLVCFGVVMVFSASYYFSYYSAEDNQTGNLYSFVIKELMFACVGIVGMLIASRVSHKIYRKIRIPMYFFTVGLLILVLFFGDEVNGAKRWIFGFQPSELAKPVMTVMLASIITDRKNVFGNMKNLAIYLAVLAVPTVLIAVEDLSTGMVVAVIGMAFMFITAKDLRVFWLICIIGVVLALIFIFGVSYRSARINVWLHPFDSENGYQVVQSLYSVASGGMFGLGLGGSRQKLGFMPEAHNDIIFAIICEELGFLGAVIVVLLFIILIWRGIIVAKQHSDDIYSMLVAAGITITIATQVLINISVVTNTIPNTGIALPFISYGGTSLTVMLGSIGILLNVSRYKKIKKQ